MIRKILLLTSFGLAVFLASQAQISEASGGGNLVITKIVYKELRDGKHNIVVFWEGLPKECPPDRCLAAKIVVDVELTDARGARQKASITFGSDSGVGARTAGNPDVSFTPVPIPKDPIVGVPITELFRGRGALSANSSGSETLKFKVTLTLSALTRTGTGRTITEVVRKEGTLKAVAKSEGK